MLTHIAPGLGLAKKPIDPDVEERRDQRVGTVIVVLAYGAIGVVILGVLLAFVVVMLWLGGGS